MFDAARVRSNEVTEAAGYAGAEGVIFGITTVSVTLVDVVGVPEDDTAINLDFEGRLPSAWFPPSFVEVIGQPATVISIGGARIERSDGGEWREVRKPWWRFW